MAELVGRNVRPNSSLPAALAASIASQGEIIPFEPGQQIIFGGEHDQSVYLIKRGTIQFSLLSPQGKEVILRDMSEGDFFGESASLTDLRRSANAVALTFGALARLNGSEFMAILKKDPTVSVWLAELLAHRVLDLTAKVFELATLPVAARLQLELIRLAEKAKKTTEGLLVVTMPTHSDIAAKIGTHREAVTRELNLLSKEGIITKREKGLEIPSLPRLRACYARFTA